MILSVVDDIPIKVNRTRRKKTAEFSLQGGGVRVLVPDRLSDAEIDRLIHRRLPWIRQKVRDQESVHMKRAKEYVSGESFTYLGRNYRLKIRSDEYESVKLKGGRFVVSVLPDRLKDADHIAQLLKEWYVEHAENRLREKVLRYGRVLDVSPASMAIKDYRSRWGSCTNSGNIGFDWRIIIASHRIVDYVVVHELAHLLRHDHSEAYWQHVRRVLPDYKDRRHWLKENGHLLAI